MFRMFDQMFDVVQILPNTIQDDQTWRQRGKMFGDQTMIDGQTFPVWTGL